MVKQAAHNGSNIGSNPIEPNINICPIGGIGRRGGLKIHKLSVRLRYWAPNFNIILKKDKSNLGWEGF